MSATTKSSSQHRSAAADPPNRQLSFDIGIRVSKVGGREGESFISPVLQRERCQARASSLNLTIGRCFEELDVSGYKPERSELEAAVRRVEAGESGGLIVARVDRFCRRLGVWASAIERIYEAGGEVISAMEMVDFGTNDGRLIGNFLASIAEFDRNRLRETFIEAGRRAVDRKVHFSPVPPLGYEREPGKPLTVHPTHGPIVSQLFTRAARGESWAELARWLMNQRTPTAYGRPGWTGRSVKQLVRNRVYLGVAFRGEFECPDAHPALTDEVTFKKAERKGRIPTTRSKRPVSPLAGLVRCAGCRYGMRCDYDSRGDRRYRCHRDHAPGRCPAPTDTTDRGLEAHVERVFFEAVGDIELQSEATNQERAEAEDVLKRREAALSAWVEADDIQADMPPADWKARYDALRNKRDEAVAALAELPEPSSLSVTTLRQEWPGLTVEEKRRLFATVIDAIFLRRATKRGRHAEPVTERVWVCLRGEAPKDMPGRNAKRASSISSFTFPEG